MKTGIISSAQVAAEAGHPLDARFWLGRRGAESYAAWKRRTDLEDEVRHVRRQLGILRRRYPEAWAIAQQEEQEGGGRQP